MNIVLYCCDATIRDEIKIIIILSVACAALWQVLIGLLCLFSILPIRRNKFTI